MSSDIVLKVNHIGKRYEIYEAPHHRLFQTLFRGRKQFYKEFWALRDVSFEVKRGECVGIIGRNGSGKSTLLQIIVGTLASTAGDVEATGRVSALLELGSGFNPEFTGRENVYMNGAILGLSKTQMDKKFDEIAAFAEIGEFIDQPVKIYSSGMYVRLAFSIAINVDPDILIIDEALAVGDIRFQVKCYRKFDEFREKNKTILFVSHSSSDVVRLCDRAIWLDNGIIRNSGPSKNIVEEYHAWMVHDTVVQQAVDTPTAVLPNQEQMYDLSPVPRNALITGEGGASIDAVGFFTEDDKKITFLDGCKKVKIVFRVSTKEKIDNPFFGFQIINSKGLRVLSDSNILLDQKSSSIPAGSTVEVNFSFDFPEISNGRYLIAVGFNDGSIETHVRHTYILDAYDFVFQSSSIWQKQSGLVKIKDCFLELRCLP
jgi:ABC-type polysaccharide/polyol phosphate transport system ATPase subunit